VFFEKINLPARIPTARHMTAIMMDIMVESMET
jgi:hypothetical protein